MFGVTRCASSARCSPGLLLKPLSRAQARPRQLESVPRILAIVVTRGTSNNLFQVATLVRAATALEMGVRVLFKAEAAQKLRKDRIKVPEWAPVYAHSET